MHLRIDHVPALGTIERPAPGDIDWCLHLIESPAVLWRALEHPLVHDTQWYAAHKREAPEAILSVVRAAPCHCGCGIELVAHSVASADAGRLARGMAEAVLEYAMESELNDRLRTARPDAGSDPNAGPPVRPAYSAPRHIRVMIRDDDAATV
jgi:hypothetical protein